MSGPRIGYVRVSSFDQNPQRRLEDAPIDRVFTDKASGKNTLRPQLEALLAFARDGDTVIVHIKPGSNSPYRTFLHPDGSKVSINTANKVVKINGPKIWNDTGTQKYSPRIGPHNQPYIDE